MAEEGKQGKKFRSLTAKVNFIIVLSLFLGIGAISAYFGLSQVFIRRTLSEAGLLRTSDVIHTAIENFMLPGEAPVAVTFFKQLSLTNPEYRVTLYRRTGERAFSDNVTITGVNDRITFKQFEERRQDDQPGPEADLSVIEESIRIPPTDIFFSDRNAGKTYFQVYRPLISLPKCTVCHGSNHTVRGVIHVQADISMIVDSQQQTIVVTSLLFLGMVVVLAAVLSRYLRRIVIGPVTQIGTVCAGVTTGDFTLRARVHTSDEIGRLARTVNTMAEGLYERFELTRFVSSGTIQSIKSGQDSGKTVLTMFFSDIRGFTAYSERNPPEMVVSNLNALFEMQSEVIRTNGGDIDKFVGDQVMAIFSGPDSALHACSTAAEIGRVMKKELSSRFGGLQIGIGIATGEVIQGRIGSHSRADYTVIGDTVNTAARLCGAARQGECIVTEKTRNLVTETAQGGSGDRHLSFQGPYRISVKGKEKSFRVYKLLAEEDGK